LVNRARAVRRVALIVGLLAVAALPYVNAGAWQQEEKVRPRKSQPAVKGQANIFKGAESAQGEVRARLRNEKAAGFNATSQAQAGVCAQSQPINFGQTINTGTLADGDCLNPITNNGARVDEYTFEGAAGQQVSISMSSNNFDTYLYLLRPDGTVLAENDDIDTSSNPPNLNSRIPPNGFVTLPFTGAYSILATSFAPESRGAYTLTLTGGVVCSFTPIAYGETKTGTLSPGDCTNSIDQDGTPVDYYTFQGTAGQQVSITMTATGDGNVNPFLYLLLPNGERTAQDDNGGGGTAARIPQFEGFGRLPVTGTYTIVANTLAANQSGSYNLTLTKAANDCPSVPLTFGTPSNGTLTSGDCRLLEDSSFLDAYTFDGAAGEQIAITMSSSTAGLAPAVFLLSPTGYALAVATTSTGGGTARIPGTGSFTLPTTGAYTVLANSFQAGQTGNYTLALTRSGPQQNTHTISGLVTGGGVGLSGVTVSLSGGATATTTTDENGNYSFVELPAGNNYTITPTNTAQYSFTPQTVNALQSDQIVNFNGTLRTYTVSGQVTTGGTPLSGATVTIAGPNGFSTRSFTTAADGSYSFTDLPAGGNYTVTATKGNYTFSPSSISVTNLLADRSGANFVGTPHVIISEFRFRGTNGATDEFVELYNQTDQSKDITGWSLVSGGTVLHTVASGSIPARSHYLMAGADYSLPAASDGALSTDIPDNAAVALFNNASTFTNATRLDAAGFSAASALYIEGGGLSPAGGITTDSEHAFVRKLTSGTPQDTDNNSADFVLVATDPLVVGNNAVLGAPGPENLTSPTQHNATIKGSLLDPQCAGFGSAASGCARARTAAGANPTTAQYGTLRIRRRFTNATAANVTTLRFRVVGITTLGSPGSGSGQADLRLITSSPADFNVTLTDGTVVPVHGTQVETPPAQPNGGGLNSSVITVTTVTPLAAGNSVNVEFTLGVQQQGAFSFFVNVEALTSPAANTLEATKAGPTKSAAARKVK
jgi:hypothetical protein